MSRYSYAATDQNGQLILAEITAETVVEAVRELELQGLVLRSIELIPEEKVQADNQLAEFHRRLEELLSNKSQWLPALAAVAEEIPSSSARCEMLRLVKVMAIDKTAAEFLASRDASALIPLFAVGIQGDPSGQQLHNWISSLSEQVESRMRRRRAFAYPALLTFAVLIVLILFGVFLIPVFKNMFEEFGLNLAAPTLLVISLSDQLTVYYPRTLAILLLSGAAIYTLVRVWRHHALTNRIFGRFVAGTSSNLAAMSVFTSSLAELLNLGAPLPTAMRLAGQSCKHRYFEEASSRFAAELSTGSRSAGFSPSVHRLPPLVFQALQGEKGEPNIRLLRELSIIYCDRMRSRTNLIQEVFPGLVTFIIGITVAFIIISLFMPLVSMISSLA